MTQPGNDRSGSSEQAARQPAVTDLESCVAQLAQTRREAEEYKNRYLRAAAEVDNARKQAERDAAARAVQDRRRILREFLEVADSLEMALAQPSDSSGIYQGVKLALGQLQQALARAGVERMVIKAGDTFDPVYQEAVEVREGDNPDDTVVEVVRTGYLHDGVLLRPAQVIVARGRH